MTFGKGAISLGKHILRGGAAALSLSLLLSGCASGIYANYRAVESLQTVRTLGIDRERTGSVTVSAAVDGSGEEDGSVLSCTAADIPEALARLQELSPKGQLFFAHIEYLLLGQSMAEGGVGGVLDYIERDVHTRMATSLFILRESRADALLTALKDGAAAAELLSSVQRETELQGSSRVDSVRAAAVALGQRDACLVCALEPSGKSAVPAGYAILKGDALVGYFTGQEAEAATLLAGFPGTLSRSFPTESGSVSLELRGSADYAEGTVRLALNGAVAAIDPPDALPEDLEARVSAALAEEAEAVLEKARRLDADLFGPAGEAPIRVRAETVLRHGFDLLPPEKGDAP